MLSSPQSPNFCYFFNILHHRDRDRDRDGGQLELKLKLNREIHLPEIAGHHCLGSSSHGGFLVTVNEPNFFADIFAFNPLTRAQLSLPSIFALEGMEPPAVPMIYLSEKLTKPWRMNHNHNHAASASASASKEEDDDDDRFYYYTNSSYVLLYETKAVLSPSLDTIFLLRPDPGEVDSVFALVGDRDWIRHTTSPSYCADCIFHRGLLYTIMDDSTIAVHHLPHNPLSGATILPFDKLPEMDVSPSYAPSFIDNPMMWSLVESPDGDRLFLVHRIAARHDDPEADPPRFTRSFRVFVLELDDRTRRYRWARVENLGEDVALFVGLKGASFSASCSASASGGGGQDYYSEEEEEEDEEDEESSWCIRPNCIYFTDATSWGDSLTMDRIGDCGVFDLVDGSIHFFRLEHGGQRLIWPLPVWYMPPPPSTVDRNPLVQRESISIS